MHWKVELFHWEEGGKKVHWFLLQSTVKFCDVPHSTQKGQGGKDGVVIVLIVKSRSLFKNLFIFACAGSSLLPGFSLVGARRATLPWSGQAYCGSFSCRGDGALGPRASVVVAGGLSSWWHVGLVVRLCVGSSHSRDGTRVPCIGAWTPVYPLCHQESPAHDFNTSLALSPIFILRFKTQVRSFHFNF